MRNIRFLLGVIVALVTAFLSFKIFQQETIAEYIRPIILPLLLVYYCIQQKDKRSFFFYFLFFYALSEILTYIGLVITDENLLNEIQYFGGNMLCVFAYIFLLFHVLSSINFRNMFKRFFAVIVLLFFLDIYTVYLVSDVVINGDYEFTLSESLVEIIYNVSIMLLLTASLLNYLYRDSNKAMTLLVGSLCIVFSEVMQVAYYYVAEIEFLNIAYSVLLVLAFLFFHLQTKMSYSENEIEIKNKNSLSLKELD